jgi:hypothetical protein
MPAFPGALLFADNLSRRGHLFLRLSAFPGLDACLRYNRSKPMSLQAGDELGPYEILAPIAAGGMGEV